MKRLRLIIALFLFGFRLPSPALDQLPDMEVMKYWSRAQVVHFHIIGVYQAQTNVIGDANWIGYADVTDGVVIELDWKLSGVMLVGTPTFQNRKSETKNLRNYQPGCQPPVLKGEYEHFDLLAIKAGQGTTIELQVRTTYPASEVVQFCSGAHKPLKASIDTRREEMVVPSPLMLAMQLPATDDLSISKDRKSFIVKKDGWTWTFTPSIKSSR
jgi:hypothetical protein